DRATSRRETPSSGPALRQHEGAVDEGVFCPRLGLRKKNVRCSAPQTSKVRSTDLKLADHCESATGGCSERRNLVCPVCIATVALIAAGATSTGGLTALVVKKRHAKTSAKNTNPQPKLTEGKMDHQRVVSRAEWLEARKHLLSKEKESTRQR